MFKALVIDDEELARQRLAKMLEIHNDDIEVIGFAKDGVDAVKQINSLKPDLVFLDIQMPGLTGFEVLESLEVKPKIIFTTAYDEYALKAFENNAIGYLLKPIDKEKLKKNIENLKDLKSGIDHDDIYDVIKNISSTAAKKQEPLKRIQVKLGDRVLLVDVNDILYFESQDKYTNVHTKDHMYIIDNTLLTLEEKLDSNTFMRIHRSTIVNVDWIAEIQKYIGGKLQVKLKDEKNTLLVVSRSYTDQVRSL